MVINMMITVIFMMMTMMFMIITMMFGMMTATVMMLTMMSFYECFTWLYTRKIISFLEDQKHKWPLLTAETKLNSFQRIGEILLRKEFRMKFEYHQGTKYGWVDFQRQGPDKNRQMFIWLKYGFLIKSPANIPTSKILDFVFMENLRFNILLGCFTLVCKCRQIFFKKLPPKPFEHNAWLLQTRYKKHFKSDQNNGKVDHILTHLIQYWSNCANEFESNQAKKVDWNWNFTPKKVVIKMLWQMCGATETEIKWELDRSWRRIVKSTPYTIWPAKHDDDYKFINEDVEFFTNLDIHQMLTFPNRCWWKKW